MRAYIWNTGAHANTKFKLDDTDAVFTPDPGANFIALRGNG